jgi:tetratricopeptide (TPR) repeat protein
LAGRAITTASDIYTLGILLRNLLSGESNADTSAIIAKATREEPEERYASADELAADIDRYLSGLPVLARSGPARYVVSKFVRRHPLAVGGGALAVVLGIAGILTIVYESRIATAERAKAQLRFDQVRKLARSVMYELHDSVAALPGSTSVRALLIKRSLEYLDALAHEAGSDDSLQLELADAYQRVGWVQGKVGWANLEDVSGALASYGKSRSILERLVARSPHDLRLVADLATVLRDISGLENTTGRKAEALAAAREALRLGEAAYRQDPNDKFARFARAAGYFQFAMQVEDIQQKHDAWMKALEADEAELSRKPSDENAMRNVALVHKYLASPQDDGKNLSESLRHAELARDLDMRRLSLDPNNRMAQLDLTFDLSQIALIQTQLHDYHSSLQNYQRIETIRDKLAREDPRDASLLQRVAAVKNNVGESNLHLHHPDTAAIKFREAVAIAQALAQKDSKDLEIVRLLGFARSGLGEAEVRMNQRAAGCADLRAAQRAFIKAKARLQPTDSDVVERTERGLTQCR